MVMSSRSRWRVDALGVSIRAVLVVLVAACVGLADEVVLVPGANVKQAIGGPGDVAKIMKMMPKQLSERTIRALDGTLAAVFGQECLLRFG